MDSWTKDILGVAVEEKPSSSDWLGAVFAERGQAVPGRRRTPPPPTPLTDEERQSVIESVAPKSAGEQIAEGTVIGDIGRAINRYVVENEGIPYVEPESTDYGRFGNLAIKGGSIIADPATYIAAGGARTVGKALFPEAIRLLEKEGAKRLILRSTTTGATTFAGMEALKNLERQYADTGEVSAAKFIQDVSHSGLLGAATGPAAATTGKVSQTLAGATGLTAAEGALEGKVPTEQQFLDNLVLFAGIEVAHKVADSLSRRGPEDNPVDMASKIAGKEPVEKAIAKTLEDARPRAEVEQQPVEQKLGERIPGTPAEEAARAEAIRKTNEELAALADKETISRKEYQAATGATKREIPNAAQRKAEALAERQKLEQEKRNEEVSEGIKEETVSEAEAPKAPEGKEAGAAVLGSPTSLKFEVMDRERAEMGLPPMAPTLRVSNQESMDAAVRILDNNPHRGRELVDELLEQPRAVSTVEQAVLLAHRVQVRHRNNLRLEEYFRAEKEGRIEDSAAARMEHLALKEELNRIDQASKQGGAGSETARSLQFRRMFADEDFTLSTLIKETEALKGKPLDKAEEAHLKDIADRYAEASAKYEASQEKVRQLEAELAAARAVQEVRQEVKQARPSRIRAARAEVDATWADFTKKATGKLFSNPLDPEVLGAAANVAKAYAKLGVATLGDFLKRVGRKLGKDKLEKSKGVFEAAWKSILPDIGPPKPGRPPADLGEISKYARELTEHFVERGMRDRDQIVKAVHAELKKIIPKITEREAMDAISRYGQYKLLDKSELKAQVRDVVGQLQQVGKLKDMEAGVAPKKTGIERRTPSDEERHLIQQVNEMKKKGGFAVPDPATQLKTALDGIKTRMTHQIADLEQQVETKTKIVKERRTVPLDAEAKALMARRDALKKQFDDIFGKPELTDAQRVERATRAVRKSIEELNRKLASKDISPMRKPSKTPRSAELDSLRAKRLTLRLELKALRDLAKPKKTPEEKRFSLIRSAMARKIADRLDRIERKDFDPRRPVKVELTPEMKKELLDDQLRVEAVEREYRKLREQYRLKNRNLGERLKDYGREILSFPKGLLASLDVSIPLRQGKFGLVSHPIRTRAAWKDMFAARTEGGAARAWAEIRNRKNFVEYAETKLPIVDPVEGKLSRGEEVFVGTWAEKIPGVKMSQRMAVSFLNRMRADYYDGLKASIESPGAPLSLKEKMALARGIGEFTGRADAKWIDRSSFVLDPTFWSPRFVVSRFRLAMFRPTMRGTARTRVAFAKEYARTLVGLGAYYSLIAGGLYAAFGLPGEDKYWDIDFRNTNSSTWGTIRIGKTRIDPLAGLKQVISFSSSFIKGERVTATGKTKPLTGQAKKPFGETRLGLGLNFLRQKLSPWPALLVDELGEETFEGTPPTWKSRAESIFAPLAAYDVVKAMMNDGLSWEDALTIWGMFGEGVRQQQEHQSKTKFRKVG